jgi:hypothetical protein
VTSTTPSTEETIYQRIRDSKQYETSQCNNVSVRATTQPGEDNHELALEFCLHQADFHRFADTNPRAVDEQYDRYGTPSNWHAGIMRLRKPFKAHAYSTALVPVSFRDPLTAC